MVITFFSSNMWIVAVISLLLWNTIWYYLHITIRTQWPTVNYLSLSIFVLPACCQCLPWNYLSQWCKRGLMSWYDKELVLLVRWSNLSNSKAYSKHELTYVSRKWDQYETGSCSVFNPSPLQKGKGYTLNIIRANAQTFEIGWYFFSQEIIVLGEVREENI